MLRSAMRHHYRVSVVGGSKSVTRETMRAARLLGRGRLEVQEAPVPDLADGQVLVRTRLASICGSDLKSVFSELGPPEFPCRPGFPGHEGVGDVVESRAPEFQPGDLVLTVPDRAWKATFADYQVVPTQFLIPLPPDGDPDVLIMAQQLGTVLFALDRFWPEGEPPGGSAAVIGAGSAGLYFTRLLKHRGFAQVLVADPDTRRLELARQLGADALVPAGRENVVEATMDLTGGRGADLAVEAAGFDATRAQAIASARVCGRVGFFGQPERYGDAPFPLEQFYRRRPTLVASNGTQQEPGLTSFRRAVDLIRRGDVEVRPLIGSPYGADDLPRAFEDAYEHRAAALKVSVSFD
jgi:L-iditol 2-dehydrogenase